MASRNVLLVEGVDDQHAAGHLLRHHGLAADFFTFSRGQPPKIENEQRLSIGAGEGEGGFEFLRQNVPKILRLESELRRAGLVVDYDFPERESSQVNRWRSLRQLFREDFDCELPPAPPAEGWTGQIQRAEGTIDVGIWLMPDNQTEGALEAFAARLVSSNDVLLDYTDDCLDALPEQHFAEKDRDKALIHTWLAWQQKPNMRIGEAVSRGVFDVEQPLAGRFVAWVRRLFDV